MAIEEPSVIAAVSGAAKTIRQFSLEKGFEAKHSERNWVEAQVLLKGFVSLDDMRRAAEKVRFK
jgi:hydroxymethylglutaryl-CoA reductase